jgi:hypothetical protein
VPFSFRHPPSAQSGQLLVHHCIGIVAVLIQQFNVQVTAPGTDGEAEQEKGLPDLFYQSTHLLSR